MPPPGAFYTIGAFPYSQLVTSADFNAGTFGGAANEVWFKYVNTSPIAIGVNTNSYASFHTHIQLFESDALTSRLILAAGATGFIEAATSTNYWVKVTKEGGGAIGANFTFTADSLPLDPTVQPGDYLINDDTAPYGAVVMAPDGTVRGVATTVPASEILATLPSGEVLVHDRFGQYGSNYLVLLAADLSLISAFALSPAISGGFPNIGTSLTNFYVCNQANRNVYKVDIAGTVTQVATAIHASTINAIGVNPSETILYYIVNAELKIRRWNISTDVAMSDLFTGADSGTFSAFGRTALNNHPAEIVVTSDSSVVTIHQYIVGGTADHSKLFHIDASGTLLHSYDYLLSADHVQFDHISRSPLDPDFVNVWFFRDTDATGRFGSFELSSGTLNDSLDQDLFTEHKNFTIPSTTVFGPSTSCGFGTLLSSDVSPGASTPSIPTANSAECCASPGVEGSGSTVPGAGVEHAVLMSAAWTGRCDGGGTVPLLADLTDAENWSDS